MLAADLLLGTEYDLRSSIQELKLNDSAHIFGLILFSYLINTSSSSILNLIFRRFLWRETRVYLIYRKLHIFEEKRINHINWIRYMYYLLYSKKKYEETIRIIDNVKKEGEVNLYKVFIDKLSAKGVEERLTKNTLYLYETIRTIVLDSGESEIISWIQYHWSHLRLARSTLFPIFLMMILIPLVLYYEWSQSVYNSLVAGITVLVFFIIQFLHYYYREKFMIYAMISYLFVHK
jgi:hypothetical protein